MRSLIVGFGIGAGIPFAFGVSCILSTIGGPSPETTYDPDVGGCGLTGLFSLVTMGAGWIAILSAPFTGAVGTALGYCLTELLQRGRDPRAVRRFS